MSVDEATEATVALKERVKAAEVALEEGRQALQHAERVAADAEEAELEEDHGKQSKLEVVHIFDEERGIYSYRVPFAELSANLPIHSRYVPDYPLIRRSGLFAGVGIAGFALFFSIVVGIKFDPTFGIYAGLLSVVLAPVLALIGWDSAPRSPLHDYKPFWIVRMVTSHVDELELSPWHTDIGGDLRRYLVPFSHSYLNLRSIDEEKEGEEYTPFVMRATTAFNDASMREEKRIITSKHRDKWEKIKTASLIGLIFAELLAVFFLFVVTQG